MNTLEILKEEFNKIQHNNGKSVLTAAEQKAFSVFSEIGLPTVKNEEWKYTRITQLFNKEYAFNSEAQQIASFTKEGLKPYRLPGADDANELVFVNGFFQPELSTIHSDELNIQNLSEAANGDSKSIIDEHLNHSANYIKDGIHALNTAFMQNGVFINIYENKVVEHPVYIYNIIKAEQYNILAQPRTLIHVGKNAEIKIAETFITIGENDSLTNRVAEVVVQQDARVEYYIIQNDKATASQINTTHIRQTGKSVVNTVTLSFNGAIIRNNLNIAMEAAHTESHFYGLYFLKNNTHCDNHTVVDNLKPNCLSNQLYKGVIDDNATAVFNGKILVEKDAQKINAFQSNKNILLSDDASVNTKPQLEIFADDVKCSHGCTIGQLDEESMFYMRSRGIGEEKARALLIQAFVKDILDYIQLEPVKNYAAELIANQLNMAKYG